MTRDEGSGTTGRAIVLETKFGMKSTPTQPMVNAHGWSVTLSKAYLSVGALYYYSGDPVISRGPSPRRTDKTLFAWMDELFVKTAHAHPGHYVAGTAMGQMLEPTTVDLLSGSIELADGNGVSGLTRSATFTWQSPPRGPVAAKLDDQVILTQGLATKDDVTVEFVAKATDTEIANGDEQAEVAGCAFGDTPGEVGVDMDGDGTVTLTLVPRVWFDQVDFAYVIPGTEGAPLPNANGIIDIAGTLAWQGFIRGVKKGTAYQFSYSR
jgi:hypothetical protein